MPQKLESDQREFLRMIFPETPNLESAGRDPMRIECIALNLEPEVDHRFDGIPSEIVDQLTRQVLQSPKEARIDAEVVSGRRKNFHAYQ